MIYLINTTDIQTLFIPLNGADVPETPTLELRNTTDHQRESVELSVHPATSDYHNTYLIANINLPDGLADGEFEYSLMSEGLVLSNGLLMIGEAKETEQFDKSIQYEQYK